MSDECDEAYNKCTADRRARVERVLAEAQPWETERQLAEKAKVTDRTIRNVKTALLQNRKGFLDCNKTITKAELRQRYPRSIDRERTEPEIVSVLRALRKCSKDQLAYLWVNVFPSVYQPLSAAEYEND